MTARGSRLTLPAPRGFDLHMAVVSYGFSRLAPTQYDDASRTLHHTFQFKTGQRIAATITLRGDRLRIACDRKVDPKPVRAAVTRMLRLDEDFTAFWKQHKPAKKLKFARLFRSASLFEDIVKTMTCCNVAWPNTKKMNVLMVERIGRGAFPTPRQIADYGAASLKADCKVGYRAERIWRLGRDVADGTLDLDALEADDLDSDALFEALRDIHGVGPYAAANLLQLLGHYDRVAIDTEAYSLFEKLHGVKRPKTSAGFRRLHKRIDEHYATYEPYQFLAYWYDLWATYQTGVA